MFGKLDIMETVEIFFVLTVFIFTTRLVRKSKIYIPLLIFVCISMINIFVELMVDLELIRKFPHLININEPLFLLQGLLLFLYIRNLLHKCFYVKINDLIYFIPFVLAVLINLPFFILSGEEKLFVLSSTKYEYLTISEMWEWLLYSLINVYFFVKALRYLKSYNQHQKYQLSNVEGSNLYYTQKLIQIYLSLFCVELILVYGVYYGVSDFEILFSLLFFLVAMVLLLIILDAIVSHKQILENQKGFIKILGQDQELYVDKIPKYAKSSLNMESSEKIKKQLLIFMNEEKPYLNPKLRIRDLSELIGIPAHHLSQVMNESLNQNFFDFINSYRVKDTMKYLKDPEYKNYTYETIAYEVGFNSRSAFYTAFKKKYGKTPSNL